MCGRTCTVPAGRGNVCRGRLFTGNSSRFLLKLVWFREEHLSSSQKVELHEEFLMRKEVCLLQAVKSLSASCCLCVCSYRDGAVVLMSMNLGQRPVRMRVPVPVSNSTVETFVLQSDRPGEDGLRSRCFCRSMQLFLSDSEARANHDPAVWCEGNVHVSCARGGRAGGKVPAL